MFSLDEMDQNIKAILAIVKKPVQSTTLTIEFGPNTLLALAQIFGNDDSTALKVKAMIEALKTSENALEGAIATQPKGEKP